MYLVLYFERSKINLHSWQWQYWLYASPWRLCRRRLHGSVEIKDQLLTWFRDHKCWSESCIFSKMERCKNLVRYAIFSDLRDQINKRLSYLSRHQLVDSEIADIGTQFDGHRCDHVEDGEDKRSLERSKIKLALPQNERKITLYPMR